MNHATHAAHPVSGGNHRFPLTRVPSRVLVIVTRRIGDVLLTGPLVRSLKDGWPSAQIDLLVLPGTENVLAGNPDIHRILVTPPSLRIDFMRQLWRSYDLAISTSPSDRPTLYAWWAGRLRIGVMTQDPQSAWKRMLLHAIVPFDNLGLHTVVQNLRLADLLGLPRRIEIPIEWSVPDEIGIADAFPQFRQQKYAVLHVYPKFAYKMWNADQWRKLAHWLNVQGLTVALTGSGDPQEMRYISEFAQSLLPRPVNLTGRLAFTQLALLLQRAALYVGPDTVTTHLAAAMGTPTVALFGPSNPVKWGPWPRGFPADISPYRMRGTQVAGNVALVQGFGACVPCLQEGCARHLQSESVCLQMLPVADVIDAAGRIMNRES